MLGIIYLLLAGMLGCEASKMLTGEGWSVSGINRIWLMLPASFGVGTLLLTWTVYIISWFFSVVGKAENPLLYGNIIGMTGAAVIMILLSVQKYRKQGSYRIWNIDKTQDKRRLKKEILLFGLLTVFITYMMFYVFYIKDGILYSGLTVYGDYAPHTAMMRSFSAGNNFPTQYPHYGGADVKYHFMFQFLTGNLEYLGMRMDFAYNIVSTLSLVGFLMLLYQLALRITGKMCCGVLALFLFFFRSGMAFFRFVWEHIQAGNLVETPYKVGMVLSAGSALATVASENSDQEIVAALTVSDRPLINVGDPCKIAITGLSEYSYGNLTGTVTSIDSDVTSTESGSYYKMTIKPNSTYVVSNSGDKVDLANGMSVTARVEYDKLTYFEYVMEALGVLFR